MLKMIMKLEPFIRVFEWLQIPRTYDEFILALCCKRITNEILNGIDNHDSCH